MSTTISNPATPWRRRAAELANWTMARLVNRTDVWGAYLSLDARGKLTGADGTPIEKTYTAPAREKRGQVFLTADRLRRHFTGLDVGDVIGTHAIGADGLSRWCAAEIDNHGNADPVANRNAAIHWFDVLTSLGFNPLLTDSDGRGGYHLRAIFREPVRSEVAHHFAKWLTRDFRAVGLGAPVEVFPKQPRLSPDVPFGSWLRVPGRHHTRDCWARVYDGWRWVEGAEAVDFLLHLAGDDPGLIPAEAAPPPPTPTPAPPRWRGDLTDNSRVKRAAAYVAKMQASVSGCRGHDRLLSAACRCREFALSEAEALPILSQFNQRCDPPWPEHELSRKYQQAEKFVRASDFGKRLADREERVSRSPRRRVFHSFAIGAS